MNSPQRDVTSQLTGLELLNAALAHTDVVVRARRTWTAVHAVEDHAVPAIVRTVLPMLSARADLTADDLELLHKVRYATAEEVFRAFQRAIGCATQTLTALAKATPSPVHGSERAGLVTAVRRRLIAAGYDVDEATARKATYAVADAVAAALRLPARPPLEAQRLGAVPLSDGPIGDHDLVDWRTGEPKVDPCQAARDALAAVLAATAPTTTAVHAAAA